MPTYSGGYAPDLHEDSFIIKAFVDVIHVLSMN